MTTPTRTPLPMVSTGCACCTPAPHAAPVTTTSAVQPAAMSETYLVTGMTCGHCTGRITEALCALEGVSEVHVELVPGGASAVTVTGTPVTPMDVRDAVERAGYTLGES